MRLHILGICGTFMGGIAAIAKAAGHSVSGADAGVYPPMSTQLERLGIELTEGYDASRLPEGLDCVVVGNALSRGKPVVEALLDSGLPYCSGPEWLAANVLHGRHVLAVAGTHGKTTTSSMLAWILEYAGLDPGFLIGGVPRNFGVSARLGGGPYFVVEADEYDTAFFDKRAKFVHYRPRTLVVNNVEYDHADIYPDLESILRQFHHLVRTVPGSGRIVANGADANFHGVLGRGCWTPVETFSARGAAADWVAAPATLGGSSVFETAHRGVAVGTGRMALLGTHNVENALAAIAAAAHVGVAPRTALEALTKFTSVKRRLELLGTFRGVTVYEDFAHHPTAIETTLAGLRAAAGDRRIVAVVEPRSNTMRMGAHGDALGASLAAADRVFVLAGKLDWQPERVLGGLGAKLAVVRDVAALLEALRRELAPGDYVVLMSNGSFDGLPRLLPEALAAENG
jgi:UDP-N-acetylmuramate: L-alanyl-gamma-D-glutamyl-meso-diaminopimelate ligase